MKTYEIKVKIKLSNYPKWIISYIEEGLERDESVVEYDITPDFEEKDIGGGLKKRIEIKDKADE